MALPITKTPLIPQKILLGINATWSQINEIREYWRLYEQLWISVIRAE